jgi:hypothetical protein
MNKMTIHADGNYFYPQSLQDCIFVGDRRHFGRSDEGEIAGVEAEQHPFTGKIG